MVTLSPENTVICGVHWRLHIQENWHFFFVVFLCLHDSVCYFWKHGCRLKLVFVKHCWCDSDTFFFLNRILFKYSEDISAHAQRIKKQTNKKKLVSCNAETVFVWFFGAVGKLLNFVLCLDVLISTDGPEGVFPCTRPFTLHLLPLYPPSSSSSLCSPPLPGSYRCCSLW